MFSFLYKYMGFKYEDNHDICQIGVFKHYCYLLFVWLKIGLLFGLCYSSYKIASSFFFSSHHCAVAQRDICLLLGQMALFVFGSGMLEPLK